ncbi:SET and MYND domain-containing protein 4 [Eumeta japonica]|uniref:SET and MYND domain-containing protein 4 n=1 Tax=Eumeta variegata TaxID=151549 RepID=A0A4C1UPF7_EUMVA|nr:SET and MYND domain-containing protein 4 [Eumeta japonica]
MSEENEGFFRRFHETVTRSMDDVGRNNFANLESDSKRVAYVWELPAVRNYNLADDLEKCQTIAKFPVAKDSETARNFKSEGNGAVQKGDWAKALHFYNQSLMHMPQKEAEELSILLANRSAALNHLERHEEALSDITRCLAYGYPKHLQYKVFERRARCLLVLKRNVEAIKAFKETLSALDDTKLDKDKKQKMRLDAQIMIEVLNKGHVLAGCPKDPEPVVKTPKPKLSGKNNSKYPAASEAIQIDFSEEKGRYATATRDITAGEILLVENPYSAVLLAEYSRTHCQDCFKKCPIPLTCPNCPNVVFCSEKCLDTALKTYHGYECPVLPLIWSSGCSITCQIALRMITQKNIGYIKNLKDLDVKPCGTYKTDDYKNVYHLVAHEEKRSKDDFLHRSQMAAFLVKMLEISGYFDDKPRTEPVKHEELKSMAISEKNAKDGAFIGGLVLKNLQILQFNAHEVFELQCPKPQVGKNVIKHEGKSVFLAGAIFPTLALFNHSCDPGVVRYFSGPTIVVRAVKNICKGQEVAENYGPIFTTVDKARRQAELRNQYWFDCSCEPCQQDWPKYDDMNETYMRFKCDSDRPCPNVVPVQHDCREFMVQCGLCQQYTNILKGLKSLQEGFVEIEVVLVVEVLEIVVIVVKSKMGIECGSKIEIKSVIGIGKKEQHRDQNSERYLNSNLLISTSDAQSMAKP